MAKLAGYVPRAIINGAWDFGHGQLGTALWFESAGITVELQSAVAVSSILGNIACRFGPATRHAVALEDFAAGQI